MALKIYLYGEIDPGTAFLKGPDGKERGCSAESVRTILDKHPNEKDIHVEIHSPGGSMHEGFAIYDTLRMSGRNIHTNIVGSCHSMAVTVLLAAPLKWRSANPNIRSLIHRARIQPVDMLTADQLRDLSDRTRREEDEMIKIYVQRTKLTERKARELITAERVHNAEDLLNLGFIGSINQYTTNKSFINQKEKTMATEKKTAGSQSFTDRIGNFLNKAKQVLSPVNFDYLDSEDNLLFSTASESDDLEVGMSVTFPDESTGGVFNLPDGRIITIEEYIVTDISEASSEEMESLRTENAQLREALEEATNLIEDMKGQIGSGYQPKNRISNQARKTDKASVAPEKEDIQSGIDQIKDVRKLKF